MLAPSFGILLGLLGPRIDDMVGSTVAAGITDVKALTRRDPAAHGDWRLSLEAYRCQRAVLGHRAAHAVLAWTRSHDPARAVEADRVARTISEQVKVDTGVDIHPGASIGAGFVVDHGVGTVIGETAVLGPRCYVLQGVVLGARGVADNPTGKRHPTLGANVEVGAFARILGPVEVGDDVVVGAHALVTRDVPAGVRVRVAAEVQQVTTGPRASRCHFDPVDDRAGATRAVS